MAAYPPGRPPTERDSLWVMNGSPIFLGTITSAGAAVNNATTATPFNQTPIGPANPATGSLPLMGGTLAGKLLLLQGSTAGLMLPSTSPLMTPPNTVVALQTVVPPLVSTAPGVALAAGERVTLLMLPTEGWLQWIPTAAAGSNLFVWELR